MSATPALSLKARALRYLARREHSRAELERKLLARLREDRRAAPGADPGSVPPSDDASGADPVRQVQDVLDELAARGLLSDERAAESLLATQGPRFGNRRLKQALLARGLAPELVRSALQQSSSTEYERARALWRRRFGQAPADAAECARQMRFLAGRGFDSEVIRRLVKVGMPGDMEA